MDCDTDDVPSRDSYMEPSLPEDSRTAKTYSSQIVSSCETRMKPNPKKGSHRNRTKSPDVNALRLENQKEKATFQNTCHDHTPSKLSKREPKVLTSTVSTDEPKSMEVTSSQCLFSTPKDSFETVKKSDSVTSVFTSESSQSFASISSTNLHNADRSVERNRDSCEFAQRSTDKSVAVSRELFVGAAGDSWCGDMDQGQDLGYSSGSTDGCNNTDIEPGSQGNVSYTQGAEGWTGNTGAYCNELEDLLFQFHNFFKNRFEAEVDNLRSALDVITEEQKSHVRQIVHRAIQEQSSQSQASDDLFEEAGANTDDHQSNPASIPSADHSTDTGESSSQGDPFNYARLRKLLDTRSYSLVKEKESDKKKDELFALVRQSCAVSTLLAKPQFRVQ